MSVIPQQLWGTTDVRSITSSKMAKWGGNVCLKISEVRYKQGIVGRVHKKKIELGLELIFFFA